MNKKLKNKIANYLLVREMNMQRRDHKSVSFDRAKTIGILYDSTNERNYELVKSYVKRMRDEFKKDVLALGYYNDKELPQMRYSKLGLDFFTKKNLNWRMKPTHPMVSKFINADF